VKLLISAYACAPNRGSEHGSAWNWTTGAARLGHELTVLVSPAHHDSITAAMREPGAPTNINWVFPTLPYWPLKQAIEPKRERTYNLLWQRAALKTARALHAQTPYDAVHHLTWGGIRAPTFLGALGIPLIVGPVGGGETSPKTLRDRFPAKGRLLEAIRDFSTANVERSPITGPGLRAAAVIFARTSDTKNILSPDLRKKTRVLMEIGVAPEQIFTPRPPRQGPPRLLYAGRLLYWKGVHIAIEAIANLVPRMPDIKFTIVGFGPEADRLRADIARYNIEKNIEFVAWMPQDQFMRLYDANDMLLFPSLHDSTGWVVLEALCKGMPVACLDLGGPKDIVTPQSGVITTTANLSTRQVAKNMADQLYDALKSPAHMAELSKGAITRAHDFLLTDQIQRLYDTAAQVINETRPGALPLDPTGGSTPRPAFI
jgi:glycosyltransferase involved in cell wall biosynthesis